MDRHVVPDEVDRIARLPTAAGFFLALFALPLLSMTDLVEGSMAVNALKWAIAGLLVLIVTRFESRSLASIGFVRPRLVDLGWAAALVVALVGVFALTGPVIEAFGLPVRQGIAQPTLVVGITTAVTAGITEEILYRGYPIERLIDAGYGSLAAGGLTWLLFTVAHFWSGYPVGNLLQIALAALVITAVYVRVRSLFPVVVGHVVIDIVGVLSFFFA